jgi:hypothetical protein
MALFSEEYRQAFASLGRPLGREDETPEKELLAAEGKLGLRVPSSLREYYRVAGGAADFNCVYDRLLAPADWVIERGRLVFMEENQAVVLYGTTASRVPEDDPPTSMATNGDDLRWSRVNDRCSVFLLVMLHWEAAFGGAMPFGGTAKVNRRLRSTLDRTWSFIGEVNRMRAYRKNGRALCFLRWTPDWRVFVGTQNEASLTLVANELGLIWET